jgi:hypothetical protein
MDNEENTYKHLYAIIRKPQEGKTFICLKNIEMSTDAIHLIVTMNTITSSLQFLDRANKELKGKICVFNSRNKKKETHAKDVMHARDVIGVKKLIKSGIEIVIMCAHYTRFDKSIIELIKELHDSISFNKKIVIHIDEAHEYVPTYRGKVLEMNSFPCVERIYMYSATPFNIWVREDDQKEDDLFKRIYVVDVEEQFNIMKSDKYFGVKDCSHIISSESTMITDKIPDEFVKTWGDKKQREKIAAGESIYWYGEKWPFQLGNERKYLSYVEKTLGDMNGVDIKQDAFSFNFVPGYLRKLSQYAVMNIILDIYKDSVVIVINGDGSNKYIKNTSTGKPEGRKLPHSNEPVDQIKLVKLEYPNKPIFITGFHCISMSVTFIDEELGNFDNVIFSHEQYNSTPQIQYQLCRYLFNYIKWNNPENIKTTKIYTNSRESLDNCLAYEKQVDIIDTEMNGSIRCQSEIIGDVNIKVKELPKERMYAKLEPYAKVMKIKQFPVSDGDDEEVLQCVKAFYKKITGNDLVGKSQPKKNDTFYECSAGAQGVGIKVNPSQFKKLLESLDYQSNFALQDDKYKYARVYVVYENDKDPSEYTWMVRWMVIKQCPQVEEAWKEIMKHKARKAEEKKMRDPKLD